MYMYLTIYSYVIPPIIHTDRSTDFYKFYLCKYIQYSCRIFMYSYYMLIYSLLHTYVLLNFYTHMLIRDSLMYVYALTICI